VPNSVYWVALGRYASWFPNFNNDAAAEKVYHVHAFPHWDWKHGDTVDIWSFSNAASVELVVNGATVSKQDMVTYGHVEWKGVPFASGAYTVTGYDAAGKVVGTKTVSSTTAPAKLNATIRDGVGATLYVHPAQRLVPFASPVPQLKVLPHFRRKCSGCQHFV
jgi:hypothetical protein